MKRLVFAVALLGLAIVLHGCAVYTPAYGYGYGTPYYYYGDGPRYGIGFGYWPYRYYGYRPYGYYYYRRGPSHFGWGGGYGRHWHH